MKAKTKSGSINRFIKLFDDAQIAYEKTPSGNEIRFETPKGKAKINHNAAWHWTIRLPGLSEGTRLSFAVDVKIDPTNKLMIFNEIMAVIYK